jgi:hypothetical protein
MQDPRPIAVMLSAALLLGAAPVAQDAPPPAPAKDAPAPAAPAVKDAPAAQDAAKPAPGKVIEGAINVYSWAPDDSAKRVEAKDADIHRLFEDLGPVATRWYQHAITLSNPFFEGRAPGLRGNDVAAEYLQWWMKDMGLEPAFPEAGADGVTPKDGDWTSYMQRFSLTGGAPKVETASMAAPGGGALVRGEDWAVLGISGKVRRQNQAMGTRK